jgi:hypothetical protein
MKGRTCIQMTKILPFVFAFISTFVFAQQQPSIFEPGFISDNGVFGFTLSPKSEEAFWVKSNGGRDTLLIMHSVKVNGKWQAPQPASFSTRTASWKDIDPMFSPDETPSYSSQHDRFQVRQIAQALIFGLPTELQRDGATPIILVTLLTLMPQNHSLQ